MTERTPQRTAALEMALKDKINSQARHMEREWGAAIGTLGVRTTVIPPKWAITDPELEWQADFNMRAAIESK